MKLIMVDSQLDQKGCEWGFVSYSTCETHWMLRSRIVEVQNRDISELIRTRVFDCVPYSVIMKTSWEM